MEKGKVFPHDLCSVSLASLKKFFCEPCHHCRFLLHLLMIWKIRKTLWSNTSRWKVLTHRHPSRNWLSVQCGWSPRLRRVGMEQVWKADGTGQTTTGVVNSLMSGNGFIFQETLQQPSPPCYIFSILTRDTPKRGRATVILISFFLQIKIFIIGLKFSHVWINCFSDKQHGLIVSPPNVWFEF